MGYFHEKVRETSGLKELKDYLLWESPIYLSPYKFLRMPKEPNLIRDKCLQFPKFDRIRSSHPYLPRKEVVNV